MIIPPVVIAVDQATECGWSIHLGRRPLASGTLNIWDWAKRRDVLREAHALSPQTPFLFAYEDHSRAPLRSYKWTGQVLALGGALWLWLDSLRRMGHPDDMRLGITSREWRRVVLGASERLGRDECKAQAVRWAQAYSGKPGLGHDESDAIALGAYASLYGEAEIRAREARGRAKRAARK